MAKKKTKRHIIVYQTQHRQLKNKQHETHQNMEVIQGASEGKGLPASHVTPVMLLI